MEASEHVDTPEATETDPAPEQSAGVTGERVITGDHGLQPQPVTDGSQDRPVATSPPPPAAQSGVPLQADRDAGVKPGESSTLAGVEGTSSPEEAREAVAANSLDPAAGTAAAEAPDHVDPAQEGTIT